MSDDEMLAWVDVETNGLTPWVDGQYLLQVAAIMTDLAGNEVSGEFQQTIRLGLDEQADAWQHAVPFVRDMHSRTGLWDKVLVGTPKDEVEASLLEFFAASAPRPQQARLAGNSVRLDLNFLETKLPGAYGHLHYRSVDVSAIAYVMQAWGVVDGYYPKAKQHEALADIRESLAEYRWLRQVAKEKLGIDIAKTV